jgi:hypothetical protein
MDYSEYTLISFGDSFTFGQGTITGGVDLIEYTTKMRARFGDQTKNYKPEYRRLNNRHSFTSHLSKNMGFKNSVNLGVMGGSNHNTVEYLHRIINSAKPTDKLFFCINLTCPTRHDYLQATVAIDSPYSRIFTVRHDILQRIEKSDRLVKTTLEELPIRFWEDYWLKLYTSEQVLYSHIKVFRELSMLLKNSGHPYIIFDGINDIDYQIMRNGISFKDSLVTPFTNIIDKELQETGIDINTLDQLVEDYTALSSSMPHYLNFSTLCELGIQNRNINSWALNIGRKLKLDNFGVTKCDHWGTMLHVKVAELLEEYIRKQDYSYLEK